MSEQMNKVPEKRAPKMEKEQGVMNVLTNEEGVRQALVNMEGPEWLEEQEGWDESASDINVPASLEGAKKQLAAGKTAFIRGRLGWHHYLVEEDGTVAFVARHSKGDDYTELARQLGFKIERE